LPSHPISKDSLLYADPPSSIRIANEDINQIKEEDESMIVEDRIISISSEARDAVANWDEEVKTFLCCVVGIEWSNVSLVGIPQ